ncbi:MAG: 5-oxoprolinase subunit PxpB [Phycisphaerales bacterium]|nr:MAG: 5-oxoprolinase subunit PxpB [Phycisphaerales bacterium]
MTRVRLVWSSERSVHLMVPAEGDASPGLRVARVAAALRSARIPGVLDLTPASTTIQIELDPHAPDPEAVANRSLTIAERALAANARAAPTREISVPVCYDADLGPDLASLAADAGMHPKEAAKRHASDAYAVRFLGFSPGFAYLDGLAPELHAPRLGTPRTRVPAGSVGIAGSRTGIYPQATPGGWRLIGATPLRVFDASRERPSLFEPGDRVRFHAVTRAAFDEIAAEQGRRDDD